MIARDDDTLHDAIAATSILDSIGALVADAMTCGKPCLIEGAPGIGKTTAARTLAEIHCCIYIEASDHVKTPSKFFEFLLDQFQDAGVSVYLPAKPSQYDRFKEIVTCLVERGAFRAIIVDEAQFLDWNTIRELMNITEQTGVPCCFVGNGEVLKRTKATESALAQLRSRVVGRTLNFAAISERDVRLVAISLGVVGEDAYQLLGKLATARIENGLRAVDEAIRRAKAMAGREASIRADHIREAIEVGFPGYDNRRLFKMTPRPTRKGDAA